MAFVAGILGSIAIGILGGICGKMTPSLPPGLEGHPAVTAAPARWWHASRSALHHHSFALLFVGLFLAKSALRLAHYATDQRQRIFAAGALRVSRRISRDWFGLLVKNAFAAFVAVLVLQVIQSFSPTHWLWAAISELGHQILEAAARLAGRGPPVLLERWWSWYGENQTKFAFWLLFSAALCDDLGLPNYKTLARRTWKRFRGRVECRSLPERL
jgi:hypothetical protein